MRKIILLTLSCLGLFNLHAQNRIAVTNAQYDAHQKLKYANTSFAMTERTNTSFIESLFGRQTNTTFVYERSYTGPGGYTHHIYQQYHLGLKVVGASVGLHERRNVVDYINANYGTLSDATLSARISAKEAVPIAEKMAASDKDRYGKAMTNIKSGEAVMVFTRNKARGFVLAYKVPVTSGVRTVYYYIDAASGELLMKEFTICGTNAPGSGATTYSGTVNFTGDFTGSDYRLRQVRNGVNIATLNNNNDYGMPYGAASDFTDNDNNWTAGEHPSDLAAIEVHWATQNVYDYWLNVHGRNSLDNNGLALNSYVHYGSGESNAYWEPTSSAMYYGDGDGVDFSSFGSLDICGHELGHGICQFTSNLIYSSAESGALNEGFSDIWGATIERSTDPSKQTWLLGEEITIVSPGYIRNMSNPNSAPFNWQQPDTYNGTNWGNLGSDPHINSGVLNYWYYLLCDGGAGTNDNGNSFSVAGLGMTKAAQIAYETELNLLSGDDYADARNMSIQRTRAIFGIGSCEEIMVTHAWYAVGVGADYTPPSISATISGPAQFCTSDTYTISGVPAGYTAYWSTSNTAIATVPTGASGNSVTVTRVSDGYFNLTATILPTGSTPCGSAPTVNKNDIISGRYPDYYVHITGYVMVPLNYTSSYSINTSNYPAITSISNFSWPGGWACYTGCSGSSYAVLRSPTSTPSTGDIRATVVSCGSTSIASKWVAWGYGGPMYYSRISPNPANDMFIIEEIDSATNKPTITDHIRLIEIVDKMGTTVYRQSFTAGSPNRKSIPVSQLKSDIYTVRIFDGKEWTSHKILVRH